MNALTRRFQFVKAIRGHWSFEVAAFVWGAFWLLTGIRDNFLSPGLRREYATLAILPKWPWYVWVIGFLAILVAMIFEAAYQAYNQNTRSVPTEAAASPAIGSRAGISINVAPTISPTISPTVSHANGQPLPHRASDPREIPRPRKPNLIFLSAEIVPISFCHSYSEGEIFSESQDKTKNRGIKACFRNESSNSRRVADAIYVRAQVIFRDGNEQEIGNGISSACWLDCDSDSIDFRVGDSQCAFLGYMEQVDKLLVPWKERRHTWQGDAISLRDNTFDGVASMEVRLIDGNNDLLLGPLVLDISFIDGDFEIVERKR